MRTRLFALALTTVTLALAGCAADASQEPSPTTDVRSQEPSIARAAEMDVGIDRGTSVLHAAAGDVSVTGAATDGERRIAQTPNADVEVDTLNVPRIEPH